MGMELTMSSIIVQAVGYAYNAPGLPTRRRFLSYIKNKSLEGIQTSNRATTTDYIDYRSTFEILSP